MSQSTSMPTPTSEPGRTLIVLATYNEVENLPDLVERLLAVELDGEQDRAADGAPHNAPHDTTGDTGRCADILVVDDNSPDGTGDWCDDRARSEPRLRCLHRSGKQGLGTAILAGLCYAIERQYAYVVTMDADFSHSPEAVASLVSAMRRDGDSPVDVVIGSRYVDGGRIENWPRRRRWMSRAVNLYARTLLRLPVRDCSGGFRCYRTARLADLDFTAIRARGYAFLEELLWHLHVRGARLIEVPITFVDRERGESKINSREAIAALWTMFRLALRRGV